MTIALFFNGQCRLANSKYFSSQTTTCRIQFDNDVKAMKIKLNGRGWFVPSTGAGKQEILQQMFRKFKISNRLPNRYFPKIDVGCP